MRRTIMLPAATLLAAACLVGAPAQAVATVVRPAAAAGPGGNSLARAVGLERVETLVTPATPTPGVTESYVRLHVPLPASDGPAPAACNWIGYLRLRASGGPASPDDAAAVMTLMPGDEAGAALYVNQARLVVRDAEARGRHVEVWIINRRSSCLVDNTGFRAAAAARDWQEVSDIKTVAEVLTDQPVDFTEPYFPTRLLTDVAFMILGNRGGDLAHLKYNGLARRPVETIVGGDGLVVGFGLPVPRNAVIVPGYHHLDVGGLAAGIQDNGKPDEVSASLTRFILTGVPAP